MNELYLDLIKKALTYSLWPDPGTPMDRRIVNMPVHRKIPLVLLRKLLGTGSLRVYLDQNISEEAVQEGRIWPAFAHTMVGLKRLDNIQYCIETVLQDNVQGDLLEAGVWRGGASILMRAVLAAHEVKDRRVFVADSFAGLPKPNSEAYPEDKFDDHHEYKILAVSRSEVESNFRKYGLLDDQVVFLEGWFKDTLPKAPIERLSVLRLDGDMYESTMDTLTALYSKLSVGGFCIIDDYSNLSPCKEAVNRFREDNNIHEPVVEIDWTAVYWRKAN